MPIFATIFGGIASVVLGDYLKENAYPGLAWIVWTMGLVFTIYMMTLW